MNFEDNKAFLAQVESNQFIQTNNTIHQQKKILNKFDRLKFLKNLRIQQDLKKLKNCLSTQKLSKKNQNQRKQLESQIQRYQKFLKQKKKEFIQENLQRAEQRKKQRLQINNATNKQLQQVKKKNQLRRQKLQSIVSQYKQQQQKNYRNVLNQRKIYRVPINIQQINQHQKIYFHQKLENSKLSKQNTLNLKRKNSKIKTQPSQNVILTFPENHKNIQDKSSIFFQAIRTKTAQRQVQNVKTQNQQKTNIMALIQKRNQQRNRMQKPGRNLGFTREKIKRTKTQFSSRKQQFWNEGNNKQLEYIQGNYFKKKTRKPKLQTNNSILNWKEGSSFQIHNLENNYHIDDIEKVLRLNMLQQKFKYYEIIKDGNPEASIALQLRTEANIAKANLLLKHDF